MSMSNLKESIQELLHLQSTFPQSLADQIRVHKAELINLHDQFVDMASELRLWSFYETQESLLSGSAAGLPSEVMFGAPLVSVKSALLDIWQEDVYAVDSDHARLAAFGPNNAGILDSYLMDLGDAIYKAARISMGHTHTPLHLRSHVKVEVIGFYEDPDAPAGTPRPYTTQQPGGETGTNIRLYSTRYSFKDFLKKGPERCLAERLHRAPKQPSGQPGSGGNNEPEFSSGTETSGLGISTTTTDSSALSPEIVITATPERPPVLPAPLVQTEPIVRPASPESAASVDTTVSDSALVLGNDLASEASHTINRLAKHQARILVREHVLSAAAGFSRPNPSLRKFMWVHMPYNNPVWVKVRHT